MPEREPIETLREVIVPRWGILRERDVLGRLHAHGPKRRGPRLLVAAVAASVVLVGAMSWWLARDAGRVESSVPAVVSAPLPTPAPVVAPDARAGTLRFTDGTIVEPRADAELYVERADEDEAAVVLQRGRARFSVASQPSRRFVVQSGLVSVIVVGTEFSVERRESGAWVQVDRGEVRVEWPEGHTMLRAGESGSFPPPTSVPASVPPPEAPSAPAPSGPSWRALARRGDHQAAFDALGRGGSVVRNAPADLMLAADVARVSGHDGEALRYLRRLTQRFERDTRAPLAAFTIGRIELSRNHPARAADAFALARRLQPKGSLAEHALAREVEARVGAKQTVRARELAAQYLSRYPQGPRRQRVRTMTEP
ncbi:MAG: FecR family protein [Deltaproteobacteria bacterium]|nr:FecR family protein [Deltaproteobacteria bacterium]